MDITTAPNRIAGGSFLIAGADASAMFTPEDFSDEQRLVRRTVEQFVDDEVLPRTRELEAHDWALTRTLLRRAAELGVLSPDVPESYGGSGLDKLTGLLVKETLGAATSFGVSAGTHSGIGTLPIVFFGTEAQKRRYLPRLAAADLVGAYALTEPTAGSDAMAIRTRATRDADGAFILNGQKQFISNASFADLFITFAKVDGEHHSCFLVERETPGLAVGAEEHKMGIKGSSTAPVLFENVRVPADALLGPVGQGHKIAFNILNMGRFTLGAGVLGEAKYALRDAIAYAGQRMQFGRPIIEFGLITQKVARMAALVFVTESMVYRTGGLVSEALGAEHQDSTQVIAALEEYAIECSINKVFATEALAAIVDEMVQIFGGYGFVEDYPAARRYRDARISRIYEGTNEINRLVIPSMALRRAQRGRLDLLVAAQAVAGEMLNAPAVGAAPEGPLGEERRLVDGARRGLLLVAGAAVQKHLSDLDAHQQILGWIADLAIELFAVESAVLRAAKTVARDQPGSSPAHAGDLQTAMVRLYIDDALPRMEATARRVLAATEEGDQLRTLLAGLRRLLKVPATNTEALSQRIAAAAAGAGRYPG